MSSFLSKFKLLFAALLLFSCALLIRAADKDSDTAAVFNVAGKEETRISISLEDLAVDVFGRITNIK